MKIDLLPAQYKPYKEIDIGTNKLIDGKALFSINGNVPLLIGKNGTPRIWISIPENSKGESWQTLVRDNKSFHPKVIVKVEDECVIVDTPDGIVIEVKKINEDTVKIIKINLRPFGLNIHGDENSLTVMNSLLMSNVFIGATAMVGIGDDKQKQEITSKI